MTAVKEHNQRVFNRLKEGDIIRIPRKKYDHYAIYIGEGNVVHYGKDEKGNVCVQEEDFFKVCKNSKAEKYNYLDDVFPPLDSKEIVARAKSMIGKSGYNLFTKKCEHLATFCQYDIKFSQQVMTGIEYFTSILLAIIITIVIFFTSIIIALWFH